MQNEHVEEGDEPPALEECEACGDEYDPDDGPGCDCRPCYACRELVTDENQYFAERDEETYCCECYVDTFTTCGECGREEYYEDTYYSERRDESLCDSCYSEDEEGQPCETVRVASCCGSRNEHLNPLTERFECKCKADARKRDPLAILARFPVQTDSTQREMVAA